MPPITYIVTDPLTVKSYLKPQFKTLVDHKWRVSVICGGSKASLADPKELEGVSEPSGSDPGPHLPATWPPTGDGDRVETSYLFNYGTDRLLVLSEGTLRKCQLKR
jgi:hypothetical protein